MNSVFRHLGLTGRILISFWLTLVFVGIAMTTLLVYQRDSHEQKEIPPVKISDKLVVKLLSQPFDDVALWFSQATRVILIHFCLVWPQNDDSRVLLGAVFSLLVPLLVQLLRLVPFQLIEMLRQLPQ